jgi:hypothetical protein
MYSPFLEHHEKKTLPRFFPSVYEEYFTLWPPTITQEAIEDAKGDAAIALARVRKAQETVRNLTHANDLRANHGADQQIYRWMFNRTRSKHGVEGVGSSASLNLTGGPPKKMAAVQTYVKLYWQSKIKPKVIAAWAPTPETDLFGEIDNGEDQVSWEAMTPIEKNIPLWFRMKIGRELYEQESDEVKAGIDQLREQEKDNAVTARASTIMSSTFNTEEERIQLMKKFDG